MEKQHIYDIVSESIENKIPSVTVLFRDPFDVSKTFSCGQTFRFRDSSTDVMNIVRCTANGKQVNIFQNKLNGLTKFEGVDLVEFDTFWKNYLDLDTNYDYINSVLLSNAEESHKEIMTKAIEASKGIRILNQDPWETMVSFIISQNNNIPRIKKTIYTLCKECNSGSNFPTPKKLFNFGVENLRKIGVGFRDAYIIDAATKVSNGTVDLSAIKNMPYDEAVTLLRKVTGIGPKVANCILLFAYHRTEAFPIDTWIRKAITEYFDDNFNCSEFGDYAGIAQQYLFYYERQENLKSARGER